MDFRQALPEGAVLVDEYKVARVLGQGGFGLTYEAVDLRLGTPVAIKEYFPSELALREEGSTVVARSAREQGVLEWGRAKFLEEARTLALFRNPNIVRVARLFEANNTAYMVLDFEMGPSLAEWRNSLGRAPTQAEIDAIAGKLLDAVEAVHRGGILHRDIKPANVIMRDGTEPVLIDFGAARQAFSAQSKTIHAIVTPGYSPKEQYAVDLDRQGAWSDIYALGATLYFLVTGSPPPDALSRDLGDHMPMTSESADSYRQGFLAAIDAAMSVRSEDRPQSVAELRASLMRAAPAASVRQTHTGHSVLPRSERPSNVAANGNVNHTGTTSGQPSAPRQVRFEDIPSGQTAAGSRGGSGLLLTALVVGMLALGGLGYWITVLAPARDERAWQSAAASNTIAAYDRYLAEQPSGRNIALARQRRQQLVDANAKTAIRLASQEVAPSSPPPPALKAAAEQPLAATRPEPAPVPQPQPATPVATAPPSVSTPPAEPPQPPASSPQAAAEPIAPRPIAPEPVPVPAVPATPPPPTTPTLPERRQLPPALDQAVAARLAAAATRTRWPLGVVAVSSTQVPGFSDQVTDFATELKRLSAGKLEVVPLPATSALTSAQILERVRDETGFMAWLSPNDHSNAAEFSIFSGAVPFGLPPTDHVRWLRQEGAHLLEQAHAAAGRDVRSIPCGVAGSVGAWFRKEIRTPQAIRGLKVRAPALTAAMIRSLGATVVGAPDVGQSVQAFRQRQLDASFGHTPSVDEFLRQPRLAAVYHFPGIHSPAYLFELLVSTRTWTGMSEPQRRLIDDACRHNIDHWARFFRSSQNDVLSRIRSQRITVRPFTGPTIEALRKAADAALASEANRNPRFREALNSYNRFRR